MKRILVPLLAAAGMLGVSVAEPAAAQSNNDDYTPLNSRIKRERQFPTNLAPRFNREQFGKATQERSRDMLNQFSRCLYNRSNSAALELLSKTDLGFVDFAQIGLESDRAVRIYGFRDCLGRVASSHSSSVALRFTPASLRQWVLQAAYLDRFPNGAEWVTPGNAVATRQFPLSANDRTVRVVMDFADCVVATSPYDADWFYRTVEGTAGANEALDDLMPALGPCLAAGQTVELTPAALRLWLGEALWHAALNNAPAAPATE